MRRWTRSGRNCGLNQGIRSMIADLFADVLPFLGKAGSATASETAFLNSVLPTVEQAVKDFTGTAIEQATYTHYLPMVDAGGAFAADLGSMWVKRGDKAVELRAASVSAGNRLILPEVPVTAVSAVYEDADAYGGQQSGDFPAASELTAGDDYWVWQHESGMCRSGILVRRGGPWPSRPGTIKVQYTAGWTAGQLTTGMASPIKLAVLLGVRQEFASWGPGGGALKSERMGDWTGTYAVEEVASRLPKKARKLLVPYIHVGRKL